MDCQQRRGKTKGIYKAKKTVTEEEENERSFDCGSTHLVGLGGVDSNELGTWILVVRSFDAGFKRITWVVTSLGQFTPWSSNVLLENRKERRTSDSEVGRERRIEEIPSASLLTFPTKSRA